MVVTVSKVLDVMENPRLAETCPEREAGLFPSDGEVPSWHNALKALSLVILGL
jgi:hypothetical protein